MAFLHNKTTSNVINAFFTVYNALGYGFAEKVYQNAMILELNRLGLTVAKEHPINVYYHREIVGTFFADLLVDNVVIVELKAVKELAPEHSAQLLNYLKGSIFEVGLLLNFGPEAIFQRKVYTNAKKGNMSWLPN
ncbi:MAG: GxxExxY protein [Caldilineaceae bacterium]